MLGASGVAAHSEVPGHPPKVWLVLCGDSGCTNGFLGAFVNEEAAEAAAKTAEAANGAGLSFYALEAAVE